MRSDTVNTLVSAETTAPGLNPSFSSPNHDLRGWECPSNIWPSLSGRHLRIDGWSDSCASTDTTSSSAPNRRPREYRAGGENIPNSSPSSPATKIQGLRRKGSHDSRALRTLIKCLALPAGSGRPHTSIVGRIPHQQRPSVGSPPSPGCERRSAPRSKSSAFQTAQLRPPTTLTISSPSPETPITAPAPAAITSIKQWGPKWKWSIMSSFAWQTPFC